MKREDNRIGSVRPSVHALPPEPCFNVKVKGRGQGQRSGSRSRFKVKGQCQRSRSTFRCAVVNIRGSALPSAAKSNRSLCVCNQSACAVNCADAVDRLLIVHTIFQVITPRYGSKLYKSVFWILWGYPMV